MYGDRLTQLCLSCCIWGTIFSSRSIGQIIPDATLNNNSSTITEDATIDGQAVDLIEGGAVNNDTLFHSFAEFSILPNQQVYFDHPNGINNILTRVTGDRISQIMGKLGVNGTANLFLLNPNGIVFGENAALDIAGSFVATTADSFVGDSGEFYSATNPEAPPLLTINIPQGLQFGSNPGSIEVQGNGHQLTINPTTLTPVFDSQASGLAIAARRTLALIGGELNFNGGGLSTAGGTIKLGSIAQPGQVGLTMDGKAIAFNYDNITAYSDINLAQKSSISLIEQPTGNGSPKGSGSLELRGRNITLEDSSTIIAIRNRPGSNEDSINIFASDSLNLLEDNPDNFPSAIITQTQENTNQQGVDINIDTTNLKLQNNALIISTVASRGDGGEINIVAQELDFNNSNSSYSTGIISQVLPESQGDGGIIIIDVENLELSDNFSDVDEDDLNDDLEAVVGANRADQLEDLIEDDDDAGGENVFVGLNRVSGDNTFILPGGGQISVRNNGVGNGGIALIKIDNTDVLELSEPSVETPEVEAPEMEEVVAEPDDQIPEEVIEADNQMPEEVIEPTPELESPQIESDINSKTSEVVEEEISNEVIKQTSDNNQETATQQPSVNQELSTEDNYVFNLNNGETIVIDTDDLNQLGNEIAADAANTADAESEDTKMFIDGLFIANSFNSSLDLFSACHIGNNNFTYIGRGGIRINPLEELTDSTLLPDWEITPQKIDNSSGSANLKFLLESKPIVEAQSWKINQNGKVELVATSVENKLTWVDRVRCPKN